MNAINLASKFALFDSHWDPKVVADYNNNEVMVVKFQGEFPFHKHDTTDDFFLVLEGEMVIEYDDKPPTKAGPGELVIVPRGQVHRPCAKEEVKVLLIEPKGEPNSGDAVQAPAPKDRI